MLAQLLVNFRLPVIILLNLGLTFIGYLAALGLRFDFSPIEIFSVERLWLPLTLLLLFRSGAYIYCGLNRGYWRYASTHDFVRIFKAHVVSTILFVASILLLRIPEFPRSVVFIEFTLSLLLSGGSRLLVRLVCERFMSGPNNLRAGTTRDVIVIGAGDSGHLMIKNLRSQRRLSYHPVAVLDDSERMQTSDVYGVPVVGRTSDLEGVLRSNPRVAAVIVAIPTLSLERLRHVESVCQNVNVPVKRLQSFEDIACIDALHPQSGLSVESVLEKEIHIEHEDEIRRAISGRRVLVTGAGGSIGSELVRQLLPFAPGSLVLFDNGEYNLFRIEREIRQLFPAVRKRAILASISDESRLRRAFEDERPEIVFHAAAFKHVPLLEENPYEAVLNNIIGTRNLLRVSYERGVERLVMISTDKAVAPCSIMGASKRISEMLVQSFSQLAEGKARLSSAPPFSTAVVRFGNVINSNGSVVPLFKEQILGGGPVTVTHPEMERFFMSIREAVRLVLTAGTLGEKGEIYVLDMGKPIRIVDVAKKMLALYGRRDLQIEFTGIRPGEKLKEELTDTSETQSATRFRKVNRLLNSQVPSQAILEWVENIESRLPNLSDYEIRTALANCLKLGDVERAAIEPGQSGEVRSILQ